MTLQEAIEIVTMATGKGGIALHDDYIDAQKLLIEAGNFRLRWEQQEGEDDFLLLPGETKD